MSGSIVSEGFDAVYDSVSEIGQGIPEQPRKKRSETLLLPSVFVGNEEQTDCSNKNDPEGIETVESNDLQETNNNLSSNIAVNLEGNLDDSNDRVQANNQSNHDKEDDISQLKTAVLNRHPIENKHRASLKVSGSSRDQFRPPRHKDRLHASRMKIPKDNILRPVSRLEVPDTVKKSIAKTPEHQIKLDQEVNRMKTGIPLSLEKEIRDEALIIIQDLVLAYKRLFGSSHPLTIQTKDYITATFQTARPREKSIDTLPTMMEEPSSLKL